MLDFYVNVIFKYPAGILLSKSFHHTTFFIIEALEVKLFLVCMKQLTEFPLEEESFTLEPSFSAAIHLKKPLWEVEENPLWEL